MADNIHGASLDGIFERLTSVPSYHPLEAETFADWSLEAGDIVTVSRDGKSYPSPVHTAALTWRGQPEITVNSSGNEERDPVAKVSKKKYNRGSGGIRNNIGFYNDVWAEDGHVHSVISQTASEITAFVEDVYAQMVSGLQLTSSSAALYVRDMYNQMTSGLALTSSSAAMYVHDMYNQLSAGLALTSSSAAIYVRDMYNQLCSGLELTSSTAAIYVRDMYNQLTSGLKLTSSTALLYVKDMYNQMVSGLKLTSSSAALYVKSMYDQMASGLKLTSSSAAIYVRDMYRQMTSGLKLTSSSAAVYVRDAENRMKAGLDVTSSEAKLYAESYNTAAKIVARINASGSSEAIIQADHVKITGTTTLNDIMTITDGSVHIKKPLRVEGTATVESLTIREGSSSASLSELKLEKLAGSASYPGAVIKAETSNGVLTLTHMDGSVVTFNKAVSLRGSWNGTTYTVSATSGTITGTPPSTTVFLEIEPAGSSVSPNQFIAAKIYEGAPNVTSGSVRTTTTMRLDENASGKYVELSTVSGTTQVRKGYISTVNTYNAGWTYGQNQRTRTTRDATSQELTIKSLDYDERFAIIDTYTKPDGTTFDVKYVVAAPSSGSGTLSASWTNGTLKVSSATSSFTSQISSVLVSGTYSYMVEARANSTDTVGTFQTRARAYGYLFENTDGSNSTAKICTNADGTGKIAEISISNTYQSGYNNGYTVTTSQIGWVWSGAYSPGTSTSGRTNAGGLSVSALSMYIRGYLFFQITVHGTTRYFYVELNP